jgi:hypothetical protein
VLEFGFNSSSSDTIDASYASGGLLLSSSPNYVTNSQDVVLTTSWQRFSGTFTIPTTANTFLIYFRHSPTGTAGTNDFVRIAGVQLEEGLFMTPFKKNSGNIQAELAACQRFYQTSGQIEFGYQSDTNGFGVAAYYAFPTTMIYTPTLTTAFQSYDNASNGGVSITRAGGFAHRAFRASASFGYLRYGISWTATAEI